MIDIGKFNILFKTDIEKQYNEMSLYMYLYKIDDLWLCLSACYIIRIRDSGTKG
jgi:hypothetical protein